MLAKYLRRANFSLCWVMTVFLFSGQNTKSIFWESLHRPQEETSVSSQTSTEKRYSVKQSCQSCTACRHYGGRKFQLEIHVAMYDWPCIQPGTSIPYFNLCFNLAANAKNKKRKAEEDDEESTKTRMTSKQVCVVCSCWHQTRLSG